LAVIRFRKQRLPHKNIAPDTGVGWNKREMEATMPDFFPGFEQRLIETTGATINLVTGGGGPALLLLHGYPQTHVMWRKVAPRLAQDFTVVVPDLRGYGDSSKPQAGESFINYSKRALALDQVEVMAALGHDRGARVTSPQEARRQSHRQAAFAQIEFATDSPLEGDGFEPSVPPRVRAKSLIGPHDSHIMRLKTIWPDERSRPVALTSGATHLDAKRA
jgi:hypothetical protein